MSDSSFVSKCLNGEVLLDEIDDFIDEWHSGDSIEPLHSFLGMTQDEYRLWVDDPSALKYILSAHRENIPVNLLISSDYEHNQMKIAARAGNVTELQRLFDWINKRGNDKCER